jgi:hypothetical protein
MSTEIAVVSGDVVDVESDLLLLKHAGAFYGADHQVAAALVQGGIPGAETWHVPPGEAAVIETQALIAPRRVMFLGTPELYEFRYKEMRQFAFRAVETILKRQLPVRTLTTTVHGGVYGFQQALAQYPQAKIERIWFVERSSRRAGALAPFLSELHRPLVPPPQTAPVVARHSSPQASPEPAASATLESVPPPQQAPEKQRVFVAMPFSDEFEDVYFLGIYQTARKCGYICERVDERAFAGNIVEQIRNGISHADFVIADLSESRPNVYLEVGLAWGQGKPVILLAREGEKLHFDVAQHKCLFYKNIIRLNAALEKLILEAFGRGSAG